MKTVGDVFRAMPNATEQELRIALGLAPDTAQKGSTALERKPCA